MQEDPPKAYDPKITDAKWGSFWEKGGYFHANPHSGKPPYSLVIPPPNVTGVLHMGHALVNVLQDILVRWKRMSGFEVLWVPGTDHAGIATQTVVERALLAEEGKRRSDYTREAFLGKIWAFKEQTEKVILSQLKQLGCSCDFSRLRFTMDEGCNRAVKQIFKQLFDEGLIYQGDYLVNWDPITQTALADDEVEYEERKSFLWHFKYHLSDESGYIRIATTRPETLLGDTAIAVSPKDPRYTHLIGKKVKVPFVDRLIPIIADHHVDPEFGTGMVKVTPAHDPNDYQMGLEHHLPFVNIFTPDGRINENGAGFQGLSREEARQAVVAEMQALGLLEKAEPYVLRVGVSYRSKAIIEPYLSKQWFVRMAPFKEKLAAAVKEGKVKILPKNWEATYFHWIDNLRDWCISRQLWWGHRIPVWHHKHNPNEKICYAGEGVPPEVQTAPDDWEQDPDVLDTWFSSALWPFSTLGWPEKTADLKTFYPLGVLVTGHDILFFWVARMLMMGEYALGEFPFPETFLHGLIYGKSYWREKKEGGITYITGEERKEYDLGKPLPSDVQSKWEKLSKSKGNVIDPLEMIAEYGTDAVRMSLCACANQSPQIDLDRRRFEEFKNFANKVWNGARFVFLNLTDLTTEALNQGLNKDLLSLEDRWILSSLNRLNQQINEDLGQYSFDKAAEGAYNFFWNDFCCYYVEMTKPFLFQKVGSLEERTSKQKILTIVLCNLVRLMHPMAPFITEELFQMLRAHFPDCQAPKNSDPYTQATLEALAAPACSVAPFPTLIHKEDVEPAIEARFARLQKMIYTIRTIRAEMHIPPAVATDLYIVGDFQENPALIQSLVKCQKVEVTSTPPAFPLAATGVVENLKLIIPLPTELAEKEKIRLIKEEEKLMIQLERAKKILENPQFLEKAPQEKIDKQREDLQSLESQLQVVKEKILSLNC